MGTLTTRRFGFAGDLLMRDGLVDADGLAQATVAMAHRRSTLGRALAGLGLAEEASVARTLAAAMRLEYLEAAASPDPAVAGLLPLTFCRRRGVLPLSMHRGMLRIAVQDPLDCPTLQQVELRTRQTVVPVVVTETTLEQMLVDAERRALEDESEEVA